jgi:hypothetical protein
LVLERRVGDRAQLLLAGHTALRHEVQRRGGQRTQQLQLEQGALGQRQGVGDRFFVPALLLELVDASPGIDRVMPTRTRFSVIAAMASMF